MTSNVQMYDKFSCLRIEMTVNDPKEFKIYKDVNHRDSTTSKRWVPMGKSISNLYRNTEISKAENRRFPDSFCNIIPVKSIEKEIDSICEKMVVHGRSICTGNPDTVMEGGQMSRELAKLRAHGLIRKNDWKQR